MHHANVCDKMQNKIPCLFFIGDFLLQRICLYVNNAQALATDLGVLSGTTRGNPVRRKQEVRRAILQLLREKQMINYFVSKCTLNSFKFEPRHVSAFSTVTVGYEIMHVAVDVITINSY